MAEIFSFFGGFDLGKLFYYLSWFLVFILICGSLMAMVIMVLVKKKQKKIIEINMITRRLRIFSGRMKKKKGKSIKQFWAQKIGRALPDFQQRSLYVKGRQDTAILLKDNNGMHHTARIPNYAEIKKWYKVVYNIELDEKDKNGKYLNRNLDRLRDIYLLPSPHEDLDWLANQCTEADKEFKVDHWWQHPNVMVVGTAFICFMLFIVSAIIQKKF